MVKNGSHIKSASQWQLQDLRELAEAEPQESLYLEFKKPGEFLVDGKFSGDRLAEELAETASAFLNADGGILLLGVQTNIIDARTELLRPLDQWDERNTFERLGITLTASQILDRINSNLAPVPFGIEAQAIDVNGLTTIFVCSVPSSGTAAHQSTRSRRYYKRVADGDQPMLDYEIRDVNNRKAGPLLPIELHLSNIAGQPIRYMPDGNGSWLTTEKGRFQLVLNTRNVGRATGAVARFDIGIPSGWEVVDVSDWFNVTTIEQQMYKFVTVFMQSGISTLVPRSQRSKKVVEQVTTWYRRRWPVSDTQDYPLWPSPETVVPLGSIQLQLLSRSTEHAWLPWRAMAEGMPDMRGAAFLNRDNDDLTLVNFALNDIDWAQGEFESQRFDYLVEKFGIR